MAVHHGRPQSQSPCPLCPPAAQELDPKRHRAKRVYPAPTQRLTSPCGYQQLMSTPIAVMQGNWPGPSASHPMELILPSLGPVLAGCWSGPLGAATMVERGSSRGQMPRQAWTGWCTEARGGGRGQEKGQECLRASWCPQVGRLLCPCEKNCSCRCCTQNRFGNESCAVRRELCAGASLGRTGIGSGHVGEVLKISHGL